MRRELAFLEGEAVEADIDGVRAAYKTEDPGLHPGILMQGDPAAASFSGRVFTAFRANDPSNRICERARDQPR